MRRVKTATPLPATAWPNHRAGALVIESDQIGNAYTDSGTSPPALGDVLMTTAPQRRTESTEVLSLADRIERMDRALNAGELAKILNVSRITIFKQAKAGRIPSFRIGTCVRFDPRAVSQWLRKM